MLYKLIKLCYYIIEERERRTYVQYFLVVDDDREIVKAIEIYLKRKDIML